MLNLSDRNNSIPFYPTNNIQYLFCRLRMQSQYCLRRFVPVNENHNLPALWEGETIDAEFSEIELYVNTKHSLGQGVLYITSRRVIWLPSTASAAVNESGDASMRHDGIDCDVQYILLHAISTDPTAFPKPCIYCQLDYSDDADPFEDAEAKDSTDVDETISAAGDIKDELFLVPVGCTESNGDIAIMEKLRRVFDAICRSSSLNPDEDEEDDAAADAELFFDQEEVANGALHDAEGAQYVDDDEDDGEEADEEDEHIDDVQAARNEQILEHLESVFVVPESLRRTEDK